MNDDRNDYLWSGTGVADPEIARLERVLAPLRHDADLVVRASPPESSLSAPYGPPGRHSLSRAPRRIRSAAALGGVGHARAHSTRFRRALALAALLAVCVCVAWVALDRLGATSPAWNLVPYGVATIDHEPISTPGALAAGRWLETGTETTAELAVADIGFLTVHPDSRLRITETRAGTRHRVQLARGRIEAFIVAPPRLFFVDTPAAVAVDLGCVYELEVDDRGDGALSVSVGWVMLENGAHAVTVPADATCAIDAERGPGTPHFDDAPAALVDALARLDEDAADDEALRTALATARARDRLSLWHLLPRVDAPRRARVMTTMTAFAPLPGSLRAEAILALDRTALDAWWNALGY